MNDSNKQVNVNVESNDMTNLENMLNQLRSLNKSDIVEMKSFTNPPHLVKLVMESICILLNVIPDWPNSKKLLSNPNQFLSALLCFDKNTLTHQKLKKLEAYIENPIFNLESAKCVSLACVSLVQYVIGLFNFAQINSRSNQVEILTPNEEIKIKNKPKINDNHEQIVKSISSNTETDYINSLETLCKSDICIMKSMSNPPKLVVTTMETICILFNISSDWNSARKLLGNKDFLQSLLNYDKDNITDEQLKKLKPYMENPDFNVKKIEKVSKPCSSFARYAIGVYQYACNSKRLMTESPMKDHNTESIMDSNVDTISKITFDIISNLINEIENNEIDDLTTIEAEQVQIQIINE